jgi:hypothetical protein
VRSRRSGANASDTTNDDHQAGALGHGLGKAGPGSGPGQDSIHEELLQMLVEMRQVNI